LTNHSTVRPDSMEPARGLKLEQKIVLAALFAMVALAWAWLFYSARQMHMAVTLAAGMAGMADATPGMLPAPFLASTFLMWLLMMTAMMTPSAAPMILRYTALGSNGAERHAVWHSLIFAMCYLLIWAVFSALAALGQTAFAQSELIGRMARGFGSDKFAIFLLAMVALYQFSPIKRVCLAQCRSPRAFLDRQWQPGAGAAIRLGLSHGLHCLGCCWLLMLLLFVGGVMNLAWVALLSLTVIIEKSAPPRLHAERWIAALCVLGALALMVF